MSQLDALLRTLAIELPVALACLLLLARVQLRALAWWRAPAVILAASLVTHPFAWHGNLALIGVLPFWPRVAVVELAVCVAEAAVLRFALGVRWPAAGLTATVMNAASFGFGLWWMWRDR
jgi:hypothetical protein